MKLLTYLLLGLALLLCPAALSAQDYNMEPVSISKDKVKIDGRQYYSHVVLERQTIYSICKAYGISESDLYAANEGLKENGLKKNAIILVPVAECRPAAETSPAPTEVSVTPVKVAAHDSLFIRHTVRWYEDLKTIASKYKVSEEDIIAANKLSGRKLSARQVLLIPRFSGALQNESEESPAAETEETEIAEGTGQEGDEEDDDSLDYGPKDRVKMVLMLPLKASSAGGQENYMDFYSGALIGAKRMAEKGISVEISTYDVASGSLGADDEKLSEADIVIGPVSAAMLQNLMDRGDYRYPVISPLDQKAESIAHSNQRLIQAPAPHLAQYKELVRWLDGDMTGEDRVIVVSERNPKQNPTIAEALAFIENSGLQHRSYSHAAGTSLESGLGNLMTAGGTNRILLVSESEAFISSVIRELRTLQDNGCEVVLYGPSKISSYETIETEALHQLTLHASMSYFVDYTSIEVSDFLLQYRAICKAEPSPFAFQGHDLTVYFCERVARYGRGWRETLSFGTERLLQSDFNFAREDGEGFINNGVRRVVYGKDYSVKIVR
ncbi:MAG: LysM peptidoglycan-binding domain-containing protein [Bacteroidales bacterium]|nr:LysM peptidoglycan-binding domain-containing protein [Bacteroidales bacterium]